MVTLAAGPAAGHEVGLPLGLLLGLGGLGPESSLVLLRGIEDTLAPRLSMSLSGARGVSVTLRTTSMHSTSLPPSVLRGPPALPPPRESLQGSSGAVLAAGMSACSKTAGLRRLPAPVSSFHGVRRSSIGVKPTSIFLLPFLVPKPVRLLSSWCWPPL